MPLARLVFTLLIHVPLLHCPYLAPGSFIVNEKFEQSDRRQAGLHAAGHALKLLPYIDVSSTMPRRGMQAITDNQRVL